MRRVALTFAVAAILAGTVGTAYAAPIAAPDPIAPQGGVTYPSGMQGFTEFGESVATDGVRVAVGVPYRGRGAVDVYRIVGDSLVLEAQISRPATVYWEGNAVGWFGSSVAIEGDLLVVGEPSWATQTGLAWVFRRSGSTWVLEQSLMATDSNRYDRFGESVAIVEGQPIVGASKASYWMGSSWRGLCGSISIFSKSGGTWSITQKLYGDEAGDHLGGKLAVDGERLASVGALNMGGGDAYVFEKSGSTWVKTGKIDAAGNSDEISVALAGDSLFVGDRRTPALKYYRKSGATWVTGAAPTPLYAPDTFGTNLAASGSVLVVAGAAGNDHYLSVYNRVGNAWVHQADHLIATNYRSRGYDSTFGPGIALEGDRAFAGCPFDDSAGVDAGSVVMLKGLALATIARSGQTLSAASPGVLWNDTVPAGLPLNLEITSQPSHGTVNMSADGSFDYTPAVGYSGPDSFSYRIGSAEGTSAPAAVSLYVAPVGRVSGVVSDEDSGLPLGGIVVRLVNAEATNRETDASAKVTLTDASGRYQFNGVAPGTYVASFVDPDGVYRDEHLWGVGLPAANAWSFGLPEETSLSGVDAGMRSKASLLASRVTRVAGADRYATSMAAAAARGRISSAIVASGRAFPDALSASSLAGVLDAAIFLTKPDVPPSGLAEEIKRLGAGQVVIVGGTSAVSSAVESALWAAGLRVHRIAGADRYATSAAVAQRTMAERDFVSVDPFIVRGDAFADALSVAPFAYMQGRPVILTKSTSAPAETVQAMKWCGTDGVIVVGGQAAVSDAVLEQLRAGIGVNTLYYYRIEGVDRYATSAAVAQAWQVPFDWIGIASGTTFADALSGGPLLGSYGGPLLLTNPTSLNPSARAVIASNARYLWSVVAFGGNAALSEPTVSAAGVAAGSSFYEMDGYSGVGTAASRVGLPPVDVRAQRDSEWIGLTAPSPSLWGREIGELSRQDRLSISARSSHPAEEPRTR